MADEILAVDARIGLIAGSIGGVLTPAAGPVNTSPWRFAKRNSDRSASAVFLRG